MLFWLTIQEQSKLLQEQIKWIRFDPVSGWKGDNLFEPSSNMNWYKGATLLQFLEAVLPPKRPINKFSLYSILNVCKIKGVGTSALGKVEAGILKPGMLVTFTPVALDPEVISIEMHNKTLEEAILGDIIGFSLKGLSAKEIKKSYFCEITKDNQQQKKQILAKVVDLNHPGLPKKGCCLALDCHTIHIVCKIQELKQKVDRRTRTVIKEESESFKQGEVAIFQLVPSKAICVETFQQYPPLG